MFYDYIAVADDSEIHQAFNQLMENSTNQEIRLKMAECALYPYWELLRAIKRVINKNPEIRSLVNKQIEDTRTAESWENQRKGNGGEFISFLIR